MDKRRVKAWVDEVLVEARVYKILVETWVYKTGVEARVEERVLETGIKCSAASERTPSLKKALRSVQGLTKE